MSLSSTSSSEMKEFEPHGPVSFMRRLALFALPLLCIFAALEWMLWHTGDSLPVARIHKQQTRLADTLYGRRYFSQQFNVYKMAGIRLRKPTILVIGSSRVMQFRDLMFAPLQREFYNAGGILQNAFDLRAFSELVVAGEIPLPRILIAGIDPWWLKKGYGEATWLHDPDEAYSPAAHVSALRQILSSGGQLADLFADYRLPARTLSGQLGMGSLARRNSSGFRGDGSKHPPLEVLLDYARSPGYVDRESPPVIERIIRHGKPFSLPAVVDEARVQLMVESLAAIKKQGVEVYAFLPPFSSAAFAALEQDRELAPWWRYYTENLPRALKRQGIEVISIQRPADLGLDDRFMLDGFHPSEVFIAQVVRSLLELAPASSLLQGVDLTLLEQRVEKAALPLSLERPRLIKQ